MTTTTFQTNDRLVQFDNFVRNFITKNSEVINRQSTSLLGPAIWGPALVPNFINKSFQNNTTNTDVLNSLNSVYGSFIDNHKEFQGNILPYLSAYTTLQNDGQLNYTRLVGIDLPNFPELKPGFVLDQNYKLYVMTVELKTKPVGTSYFNFENVAADPKNYYQAIILVKNCSLNISRVPDQTQPFFVLNIVGNDNKNIVSSASQKNNQNKIFNFSADNQNKPSRNTQFGFNIDDDFYWKEVLNTNLQRLDDFGYSIIHYDDIFNKINYGNNAVNIQNVNLTLLNNNSLKNFQEAARAAETPWIVSQGFYTNTQISDRNSSGLKLEDRVIKLFKIHALCPGKIGNDFVIKISPRSLNNSSGWAQFDLHLINKETEELIYSFNNLDLNPDSQNFIGRVIGTEYIHYDAVINKVVSDFSEYAIQNPWIRVELSTDIFNKSIPQSSIPCGFLGHHKIKNNLSGNYEVLNKNYVATAQLTVAGVNDINRLSLLTTHAWGDNLKNIRILQKSLPQERILFKINKDSLYSKITILNQNFKMLEYFQKDLILKRAKQKHDYLNSNFYENNDENYADMFHLEKILLLNQSLINNQFKQYWQLSKYVHTGENLSTLKNHFYYSNYFSTNVDFEKVFYYFTINEKGIINQLIDSVEEALSFDTSVNVLNFNIEMLGGWDGLNLLDIDEYSINDKGLIKSPYLQELYKLGLSIINDETNGQSDLIYLPEIFQPSILEYAYNLINNNPYSILLTDRPFYNNLNNIIYGRDFLKIDAGADGLQYGFSHQKYIYKANDEISLLNIDYDQTIANWSQDYNEISNIASFGNYLLTKLLNSNTAFTLNFKGEEQDLVLPGGIFALTILVSHDNISNTRIMNPIYNTLINGIGEIKVKDVIETRWNHDANNRKVELQKINNLNVNILYKDLKNANITYTFYSDKTNQFTSGNNSILSKLNTRNTLNNIKKKVKWASYPQLFSRIKDLKNITDRFNVLYTSVLTNYLQQGLISNFTVKLDNQTTSQEDILMGLVRGSIYIQFNNQEIAQVNV